MKTGGKEFDQKSGRAPLHVREEDERYKRVSLLPQRWKEKRGQKWSHPSVYLPEDTPDTRCDGRSVPTAVPVCRSVGHRWRAVSRETQRQRTQGSCTWVRDVRHASPIGVGQVTWKSTQDGAAHSPCQKRHRHAHGCDTNTSGHARSCSVVSGTQYTVQALNTTVTALVGAVSPDSLI